MTHPGMSCTTEEWNRIMVLYGKTLTVGEIDRRHDKKGYFKRALVKYPTHDLLNELQRRGVALTEEQMKLLTEE